MGITTDDNETDGTRNGLSDGAVTAALTLTGYLYIHMTVGFAYSVAYCLEVHSMCVRQPDTCDKHLSRMPHHWATSTGLRHPLFGSVWVGLKTAAGGPTLNANAFQESIQQMFAVLSQPKITLKDPMGVCCQDSATSQRPLAVYGPKPAVNNKEDNFQKLEKQRCTILNQKRYISRDMLFHVTVAAATQYL
eukprot:8566535-Pyramimonas_sp.AAC.2